MRLVDDWKQAYKWFSVQAPAVGIALVTTWASIPDDLKMHVPGWLTKAVLYGVFGFGLIGRLVNQGGAKP